MNQPGVSTKVELLDFGENQLFIALIKGSCYKHFYPPLCFVDVLNNADE